MLIDTLEQLLGLARRGVLTDHVMFLRYNNGTTELRWSKNLTRVSIVGALEDMKIGILGYQQQFDGPSPLDK